MKSAKRFTLTAIAAASLAVLSVPASAGDEVTVSTKNGGLQIKAGESEFKIGGRLELDYVNFNNSEMTNGQKFDDAFDARRLRVNFGGKINKDWDFYLEQDFKDNTTKDAYLRYSSLGPGKLLIGQSRVPFGLEEQSSSLWISFMERSTANNVFASAYSRRLGAVYGGTGDMFGLWGGVQFDTVNDVDKTGNDPRLLTVRGVFSPVHTKDKAVHLGAGYNHTTLNEASAVTFDTRPELRADGTGRLVSTGTLSSESYRMMNLEAAAVIGQFGASAEYFKTSTEGLGTANGYDLSSWYVEGSYFITGGNRNYNWKTARWDRPNVKDSAVEVAARYSSVDLTDAASTANKSAGQSNTATLALNWYATPTIKLSANYTNSRAEYKTLASDRQQAIGMRALVSF